MHQKGWAILCGFLLAPFWAVCRLCLGLGAASSGCPLPGPGYLVWAQVFQDHLKAFRQVRAIPGLACRQLIIQQ